MCHWAHTRWLCKVECKFGNNITVHDITLNTAVFPCDKAKERAKAAGHPSMPNMSLRYNPYLCRTALDDEGYKEGTDLMHNTDYK